jgi:hypothetical protein
MSAVTESFLYESAPVGRRIRVLRISPDPGTEPLRISICEQELDGQTPFLALSYVWGDPIATQKVICNDKSLMITENLHAALRQMRKDGWQGYTWADAICINQMDSTEKTDQARMMGDIYEHAEMALVWLGKEEDDVHLGYNLMVYLCYKFQMLELFHSGPFRDPTSLELDQISPEAWSAMVKLLQRPLVWRAWVVQEYHLARKKILQCG